MTGCPLPLAAYADVEYEGKTLASSQCNNMYFFPGLALGAQLGHTKIVSDNMLMAAAEELPKQLTEEDLANGRIYPQLANIRSISREIAVAVMKEADKDGHLYGKAKRRLDRVSSCPVHLKGPAAVSVPTSVCTCVCVCVWGGVSLGLMTDLCAVSVHDCVYLSERRRAAEVHCRHNV